MPISDPTTTISSGQTSTANISLSTHDPGDTGLAWVSFLGGTNQTITPPSGWTLVARDDYLTQFGCAVYQKVMAGETGSITFTLSQAVKWSGGVAIYPGAGAISNVATRADEHGVREFKNNAITIAGAGSRAVSVLAQASPSTWAAPANWTLQGNTRSGEDVRDDVSIALADRSPGAAGLVAEASFTAAVGLNCMIMAANGGAINSNQQASLLVEQRCQNFGFIDTIVDDDTDPATMQATAALNDVVIILGETAGGRVDDKLVDQDIGVVNLEFSSYTSNRMDMGGGARFGGANTRNPIFTVLLPEHPLAGGLTGTFQLFESNALANVPYANTTSTAIRVADFQEDSSVYQIFGYEKGATLESGRIASARRVGIAGLEPRGTYAATATSVLDAAIDWAARYGPSPQVAITFELPEAGDTGGGEASQVEIADLALPPLQLESLTIEQLAGVAIADLSLPSLQPGTPELTQLARVGIADLALPALQLGSLSLNQSMGLGISDLALPSLQSGTPEISQLARVGIADLSLPILQLGSPEVEQLAVISISDLSLPTLAWDALTITQGMGLRILDLNLPTLQTGAPEITQGMGLSIPDLSLPSLQSGAPEVTQLVGVEIPELALPQVQSTPVVIARDDVSQVAVQNLTLPSIQLGPIQAVNVLAPIAIPELALPQVQASTVLVTQPTPVTIAELALPQIQTELLQVIPAEQSSLAISNLSLLQVQASPVLARNPLDVVVQLPPVTGSIAVDDIEPATIAVDDPVANLLTIDPNLSIEIN